MSLWVRNTVLKTVDNLQPNLVFTSVEEGDRVDEKRG